MARAKKTEKYNAVYSKLSLDEKKALRTELDYAIKAEERLLKKKQVEEEAKKLRDTLKIHDKVKFMDRKEVKVGSVVTISIDKVQVLVQGTEKKTIPYHKIIS